MKNKIKWARKNHVVSSFDRTGSLQCKNCWVLKQFGIYKQKSKYIVENLERGRIVGMFHTVADAKSYVENVLVDKYSVFSEQNI